MPACSFQNGSSRWKTLVLRGWQNHVVQQKTDRPELPAEATPDHLPIFKAPQVSPFCGAWLIVSLRPYGSYHRVVDSPKNHLATRLGSSILRCVAVWVYPVTPRSHNPKQHALAATAEGTLALLRGCVSALYALRSTRQPLACAPQATQSRAEHRP